MTPSREFEIENIRYENTIIFRYSTPAGMMLCSFVSNPMTPYGTNQTIADIIALSNKLIQKPTANTRFIGSV